jgi:hypothetical protein
MRNEGKRKSVYVPAGIQLAREDEVVKMIGEDVFKSIKAVDPEPTFALMRVGYEGVSTGQLFRESLSTGEKLRQWFKQLWPLKAVKALLSALKANRTTAVYDAHPDPESEFDRIAVGSVLASKKDVKDGVTGALAMAYINNYVTAQLLKDGSLDACSIEADLLISKTEDEGEYIVEDVLSLNGIALCDSSETPPGFSDANIVAVIAAMKETDEQIRASGKFERDSSMDKVTLEDVKRFLHDNGTVPSAVFTVQELTADGKVSDAIKAEVLEATGKKDEEIKGLKDELTPLRSLGEKARIEKLLRASKVLDNEPKAAVDYLLKTLSVDVGGLDDEKASAVIDGAIKNQLSVMEDSGIKFSADKDKKGDDKDKGKEDKKDDEKGKEDIDAEDYSVPANNDLIPA